MPTNLYGIGDNFHPENSHVVPGLLRRFHEAKEANAKEVVIWGTGKPKREFLFVDDLAEACLFVININKDIYGENTKAMQSHINIGTGKEITIEQLAKKIKNVVGFEGDLIFDNSKPDGTPQKLMNVDLLRGLGWSYSTELSIGLEKTYQWFLANSKKFRE